MSALLTPDDAARLLREAAATGTPIAPLRERVAAADLDLAYAIQAVNTRARLAAGRRVVGYKIGLTSRAVQAQLGVDQPDFGVLFDDMPVGDDAPLARATLLQPKVEAEIALVLGRDLGFERHSYADLISATAYALPAIEIVDSRIADWNIRLFDTVADNASSGRFVLGARPVPLDRLDLAACAMEMTRARGDDGAPEPVSRGGGRACLGNPLNAAVWLADTMVARGHPLRAGDVLLTGALGPMVAVAAGDRFSARIDGLGEVRARFE
ncbi:2-keto-4-pentenoate hydratase [Derxia gummosa]|uniref:2-keto-4-pentenoate hydratase n=1 Tax=Derxia gummosa DSM 723 TaxID=1121388 RepID=A0A8B6X4A9_9BURK|nr:fumarylacetoacetate hydrolase family protein [Derxia gummosa]